jgi:hypothetical protein
MSTLHASRFTLLATLATLLFVGLAQATVFAAVAAEPNACIPLIYPQTLVPYPVPDANESWGHLLPPIPGDPNTWSRSAGKFQRPAAGACDPEGDAFGIEYLGGTSAATPTYDPAAGAWSFTAEVLVGLNVWRFRAVDSPANAEPAESLWWVTCWGEGRANTAPVLE